MAAEPTESGIPPVRRVVTGHDAAGRAVVVSDERFDGVFNPRRTSLQTLMWTTAGAPIDNDDATDGRDRSVGLTLPGGTVLRVLHMMPGTAAPMHRTNSLDYGIVISGEIDLILDDDSVTSLQQGDVVIQRGTIHSWRNRSDDTVARVAFVLLDATPATVDGEPLPDIHPTAARPPS